MDRPDGDPATGWPALSGPVRGRPGPDGRGRLPPVIHVRQQLSDEAHRRYRSGDDEPPGAAPGPRAARDAHRSDRGQPRNPRLAGGSAGGGRDVARDGRGPFIVPAMGSHGGGDGRRPGRAVGRPRRSPKHRWACPSRRRWKRSSSVQLAGGPAGPPRPHAAEADGILAINRIKAHTDFSDAIESGLVKIVATVWANVRAPRRSVPSGLPRLGHWIPRAAAVIAGLGRPTRAVSGIVEDGHRPGGPDRVPRGIGRFGGPRRGGPPRRGETPCASLPSIPPTSSSSTPMGKDKSGSGWTRTSSAGR